MRLDVTVLLFSTMWTHTGYAPYLVTWQRFVGYLPQTYNTMSCKRITEVRPASIVSLPPS